jgi:hypothetical protein
VIGSSTRLWPSLPQQPEFSIGEARALGQNAAESA